MDCLPDAPVPGQRRPETLNDQGCNSPSVAPSLFFIRILADRQPPEFRQWPMLCDIQQPHKFIFRQRTSLAPTVYLLVSLRKFREWIGGQPSRLDAPIAKHDQRCSIRITSGAPMLLVLSFDPLASTLALDLAANHRSTAAASRLASKSKRHSAAIRRNCAMVLAR